MAPKNSKMVVRTSKNGGNFRRMMRQMIEARKELKMLAVTSAYTTNTSIVTPISGFLGQGDNINQRSGDIVFPKILNMNIALSCLVVTFYRVIVFQDMHNQGTIPVASDVLEGGLYNSTYQLVTNQQKRFKILFDKMVGMAPGGSSQATHLQLNLRLKGQIHYNGAAAATASNGPGAIYILTVPSATSVINSATVDYFAKLNYTDA
jgi:hypothetical protein